MPVPQCSSRICRPVAQAFQPVWGRAMPCPGVEHVRPTGSDRPAPAFFAHPRSWYLSQEGRYGMRSLEGYALSLLRMAAGFTFLLHGFQKLFGFFGGVGGHGATAHFFSLFWLAGAL